MSRRPAALVTSGLLLGLAVAAATPSGAAATSPVSYGLTLNILPPGSAGNVGPAALLAVGPSRTATPTTPTNFADQLEMYDALNRVVPSSLTDATLTRYYKNAPLGVAPADVVSTQSPIPGVTIRRDRFGVPHIDGATAADVAYGAGYAGIEDRMFLTDVLRHTGAANMAAFLGPTPGDIAMDQSQLRSAPYTQAEAQAQITKAVARYGAEGRALVVRLDAFIAGMNAAQHMLCPGAFGLPVPGNNGVGFGPQCPVEYAALQKAPTDYTRADIVYIASLVGGIFGKGGGAEFDNALWYESLRAKFGPAEAVRMYNDLRQKNDPEAKTTSTLSFPYQVGGLAPGKSGVALPVPGAPVASGTGADASGGSVPIPAPAPLGSAAAHRAAATLGVVSGPFGPIDLGLQRRDESNALLVDRQHSADGHPLVVFGPQTGYYTPQLLTEVDLHGPGIDARGVSFAGTQFIVELGHGVDYAWSATSADGDLVDTVFERLCNANGTPATVNSTSYLDGSRCVPIDTYVHDEGVAVPTAGGQGNPQELRFTVMRTRHGIVEERTLATDNAGHVFPVAVVSERSTYGHEADSAIGFARVNNPDYVHNATDFERAFDGVDYTFNWFYVDNRDIAYKVSGLLPTRPASVDPDLPRWGDRADDWTGFLTPAQHPHQIDPPTGYFVSWNNKQAPNWSTASDQWGQNAVHRSRLLSDRVQALIAHGHRIVPAQLVGAMMDAATVDLRAEKLLPIVLRVVGDDPKATQAIALLKAWVAAGAHRVDRARTGHYDHQAAIALFDTWWDDNGTGNGGLAKDVLRGTLGSLVDALPHGTDNHPRSHIGSSWDTVPWYGYVSKDLRQILGEPVAGRESRVYCGGGSLAVCRAQLRVSLQTAVARALAAQNVHSVDQLTYNVANDDIDSVTAGIVGVRNIDWQNRPTFQQVVNFTGHRAGAAAVAGTPEGPAGGSPAGLPLAVLPLAVVAAAAVVPSRSRRRRWGPGVLPA